ncbi:hypothetical protein BT96DRAFT_935500 [Gymnopus androsaceus JB14]|uniref:Uncharacterized protein n=1 Tax=Gymnopus androsaceus JB14 TaxID=1447944 RepID=A0A6A4I6Y2_9AGAR|nr:hypothetical protein BT96DRAFT_935500 [Gymnopus androsaceus JB14]
MRPAAYYPNGAIRLSSHVAPFHVSEISSSSSTFCPTLRETTSEANIERGDLVISRGEDWMMGMKANKLVDIERENGEEERRIKVACDGCRKHGKSSVMASVPCVQTASNEEKSVFIFENRAGEKEAGAFKVYPREPPRNSNNDGGSRAVSSKDSLVKGVDDHEYE